ncbi:hypothetical protein TR13x_08725 [Caloranaerobacter sp. TR13]|uniref:FAD binding domain-containing protein n=1 Tax=Caloranaerobacter sp. TR13 TaxID=1302151 RepID=UPI0006D496A9|nr:FAD binding domain-containing protein [Caloranaerobacter sp. TR13]KPU26743.1 hypothetical protein TR13x_08725 [Caloranaerobacter sp. TR13]
MGVNEVYKCRTVDEVLKLLDKYGDKCKLIAGGTDLIIQLRHRDPDYNVLIDISTIEELSFIRENGEYIEIGSVATFDELVKYIKSPKLEGLRKAANFVGSPQIRNRGTVGGNICNGSPAADTVPPLLALDSILVIKSIEGTREISLEKVLKDKGRVAINNNELLYSIKFKNLLKNQGLGFSKLGLRKALAISRMCISVFLEVEDGIKCKDIRIASGALGKHGLRERELEQFMVGKRLDKEMIIASTVKFEQIVKERLAGRLTVEFKSDAVKGVFKEALKEAINNSNQGIEDRE